MYIMSINDNKLFYIIVMSDMFDIYLPLPLPLVPLPILSEVDGLARTSSESSAGSASVRGGVGPRGLPGVLPSSLPSSTGGSSTVSPSCKKQN